MFCVSDISDFKSPNINIGIGLKLQKMPDVTNMIQMKTRVSKSIFIDWFIFVRRFNKHVFQKISGNYFVFSLERVKNPKWQSSSAVSSNIMHHCFESYYLFIYF